MKSHSHANYLQYDATTPAGRIDLLDAIAADAIEIAEGIEPLRDPNVRQKGRLNAAIVRAKFLSDFVEFGSSGYGTLAKEARERYPELGILLARLEELFSEPRVRDLWAALDDVRARREERAATLVASEHGAA